MEFLATLYTFLLVTICLLLAVLLRRTAKTGKNTGDYDELKKWMEQQLNAQAKEFARRYGLAPHRLQISGRYLRPPAGCAGGGKCPSRLRTRPSQ